MDQPRRIGSYELLQVLGAGAAGQVWRARDGQGEEVAIKVLRSDLSDDARIVQGFIAERSVLQRVQGHYVTRVRDLVAESGQLGIVMDLVPGGSVRGLLDRVGTLAPSAICDLGAKISQGAALLHASGVVHRDLKPENVLLQQPQAPWEPRITDFGISRVYELGGSSSQRSTALVGTPAYIAPELVAGEAPSPASDVYSIGVMLYEMACGVTPFAHPNTLAVLRKQADQMPGRPEGLDERIWSILSRVLDKSPQRRPTAIEISNELNQIAPSVAGLAPLSALTEPPVGPAVDALTARTVAVDGGQPTESVSMPARQAVAAEPVRRKRSRKGPIGALLAVVLAAGGAGAFFAFRPHGSTPVIAATTTTSPVTASSTLQSSSAPESESTSESTSSTATTTSATSLASMPNVVGMSLGDAQSALAGATVTLVDTPDETKTDGTVLSQTPAAGTANPTAVTIKVARQPVTVYLTDASLVSGEWDYTTPANMKGVNYPHAVTTNICNGHTTDADVAYNLGTHFRRFKATVGQDDSSAGSDNSALVEVFGDGRKLWSQTIQFGKVADVDIDITGVLRLEVTVTDGKCGPSENYALVALGGARLLGLPGEVPSPSATQ